MDLAMGLLFGGLAGYSYVMIKLPLSKPWSIVLMIAEPLIFILFWLLYGHLVRWVKEHITYRRTGYVVYQPKPKKERARRAVIGGVLGVVMALTVTVVGPQVFKVDSVIMWGNCLDWCAVPGIYQRGERLNRCHPSKCSRLVGPQPAMEAELKSNFLMVLIVRLLLSGLTPLCTT